jgi:hypothetical protein
MPTWSHITKRSGTHAGRKEIDLSRFVPVTSDMIGWHVVLPSQHADAEYVLVGIVCPINAGGRRKLVYRCKEGGPAQCWEDAQFTAPWVVKPRDFDVQP